MGNKLGMSSNSSESPTSEDVEEIEKGTRWNGDQEDIDRHPAVTSYFDQYLCMLCIDNIVYDYPVLVSSIRSMVLLWCSWYSYEQNGSNW